MPEAAVLTISDLVAGYGRTATVREVSIRVGRGRTVCIVGPNGAGKSTLLKSVYGQARVMSGSVVYEGEGGLVDLVGLRGSQVTRLGLNFVPQRENVFSSLTVEENLEIGGVLARRSARRRMTEIFALYPKLAQRRRQRAGTLSGGERQLLAVGRALMTEPVLLLLDEPSAALSPLATTEMFDHLGGVQELGVSLLLVEQNARQALAISDYAYVLEAGRNCLEGTGRDLMNDERVGALYLGGHVAGPPASGR